MTFLFYWRILFLFCNESCRTPTSFYWNIFIVFKNYSQIFKYIFICFYASSRLCIFTCCPLTSRRWFTSTYFEIRCSCSLVLVPKVCSIRSHFQTRYFGSPLKWNISYFELCAWRQHCAVRIARHRRDTSFRESFFVLPAAKRLMWRLWSLLAASKKTTATQRHKAVFTDAMLYKGGIRK